MSDVVYIGQVRRVNVNYANNYRHATVEPLIQSSADQKSWIRSNEDPVNDFPARGFVNWHNAPTGLNEGDHVQFDLEPHPFYNGEPDKEAFQIRNLKYPTEIIDLRNIGSERDIRILLTTKGVFLSQGPLVKRCVLWIQDQKWIGPVDLVQRAGTSSWNISSSQSLDSIRCWKIPAAAIQQVELKGTRYLLTPNQDSLEQLTGFVTWEADEVLAKRVLNRLRKRDSEAVKALNISKNIFKTYIDTIEKAGLVGSDLEQELSFQERLQEIMDVIVKNEKVLDEAASVCFAIGPVKEKLEEKAEEEYQKKLSEHELRLSEDLASKQREIKEVEGDLKEMKSQLESLQDCIATAEHKLAKKVDKFDAELTEKLREVAEKPERLFAEMAFFKAISSAVRPSPPPPAALQDSHPEAVALPEAPTISELSDLVGTLSKRLLSIGVSPQVGQALHCALLTGTVPVVTGPDALDVVRSYADSVSGGEFHWIPVGGTLFEPVDLLGRVDPSSHSLIPHPGGLLNLLLDETEAIHIVVLDGFNRAAADGYLLPLIQLLRDEAEGRGRLTIPLISPDVSQNGDPYSAIQRITWGHNVLLILRPSLGTSVMPVPRELWEHSVVIDTELPVDEIESPKDVSRVTKADWSIWFNKVLSLSEPIKKLSEHSKDHSPLPRNIRRKIERIYGAGVALGFYPDRAADQALKLGLLPYLVTYDKPLDEWSKVLEFELNEQDRRVEDIVRQMKE